MTKFVFVGTMMIPAQYAMAQAQPPQTSQMMQMLYNPFGMYHQQQIPTVQMISAPPMMPTSTTTLPTTVPAVTTRMRPVTSTSNVSLSAVNETTTTSPPRSSNCTSQQQQQLQTQLQSQAQSQAQSQSQQEETACQEQVIIGRSKHLIERMIPGPDRILPDLEMPGTPESTSLKVGEENTTSNMEVEHTEEHNESNCVQEEEPQANEQYQRYLLFVIIFYLFICHHI